jgi:lipoyl(octanoyl) transferase
VTANGKRYGSVECLRPGEVPYLEAFALQRRLHAERVAGDRPDTLVLLTHPPVVTLGRGADPAHLLLTPEECRARGVEVHETDRGGDITYHGPGQLVGYPIVDLRERDLGPREFLRFIEGTLIRLLAGYDVEAERVPGLTGVWTGDRKVAAIGIRISRGVSLHGFALNVTTDPADFDLIVPCGIRDRGVTSLSRRLESPVDLEEVADRYAPLFATMLDSPKACP